MDQWVPIAAPSYSLYVWHAPVFLYFKELDWIKVDDQDHKGKNCPSDINMRGFYFFSLSMTLSFAISIIIYIFIEKPAVDARLAF